MMGQPGAILPEQITSYNSINSHTSQDSLGSARGNAMSKAFAKAQQQMQSGMLSEAQVGDMKIFYLTCRMKHVYLGRGPILS